MYEISVVSYQGAAPADRIAAVFDADGGTIGRGPGNTLVLPDPNRFVSRLQAKIAIEDGRLAIANASSANPLLVNDRELDAGTSVRLADGDELRIGLYLLRVRRIDAGAGSDDAADRTQLSMIAASASPPHDKAATNGHKANAVRASPEAPVQPSPAPAPVVGRVVDGLGPLDPLQLPVASTSSDPFADLIPQASPLGAIADPAAPPVSSTPNASRGGGAPVVPDDVWNDLARLAASPTPAPGPTLPADFDPFAGPPAAARNPDDPLAEFAQSGVGLDTFDKLDAPIDTLFNDAPAKAAPDDVIPDPHAAPADPLAAPDSVDPIAIFGGEQPPSELPFERTEPDQVPELEAWFRPPEPRFAPAAQEAPRPHAPVTPADIPPSREPATPVRVRAPRAPATPGESPLRSQDAPALSEDALLQAFLAGAGIPNAIIKDGLTPEMMKSIGTMLAAAVQGTIELIATRAMLKREVKADVTLIATTKNNPLKFLPDAESALLQMFGARIPGFMGPVEAMQDAFQDLRAHEVGVIAGMRAALADVLRRFEPEELEKRLKPPGVLESLLPNSHQARLWETFTQMYGDISREAQDDFQTLFGKAFVAAYESEVARLKGA